LAHVVTLLIRIKEVHDRNSAGTPIILKENFRGVAQSFQAKCSSVTSD